MCGEARQAPPSWLGLGGRGARGKQWRAQLTAEPESHSGAARGPPAQGHWLLVRRCPDQHLAQGRCSRSSEGALPPGTTLCVHAACPMEAAGRTAAKRPARLLPSPGSQSDGDKPPKSWSLGHKEEMLGAAAASNEGPNLGKGSRRDPCPRQRPLPKKGARSESPLWGCSGLGDTCTCTRAPGWAGAGGRRVGPGGWGPTEGMGGTVAPQHRHAQLGLRSPVPSQPN